MLISLSCLASAAAAAPQPLDPTEMQMLRSMEQTSQVEGVTGGDFSLAAQQRAMYVQYAINGALALLVGFALMAGVHVARARFARKAPADELRQWQRYALNTELASVQAKTASGQALVAKPVDISKQGVGLELQSEDGAPIKKGESISFELVMDGATKITLSDLSGKICWAAGKKIGIQLNRVLDVDMAAIQEFFAMPAAQPVAIRA